MISFFEVTMLVPPQFIINDFPSYFRGQNFEEIPKFELLGLIIPSSFGIIFKFHSHLTFSIINEFARKFELNYSRVVEKKSQFHV